MAVTANQVTKRQGPSGTRQAYKVEVSKHLYEGTMCFVNAGGYATDVAAVMFAGIVIKEADNSTGAAGAIDVECYQEGVFELVGSGFTIANIGDPVGASDNYTLVLTTSPRVGTIVGYVSSTRVLVRIEIGLAAIA